MSTTNNNAPFFIGQDIVAIADHSQGYFRKNDKFRVTGVERGFCPCADWVVTIGINGHRMMFGCRLHSVLVAYDSSNQEVRFAHQLFAPINPSYSDATQSILEQFRKDEAVKDKCDSPIKVLETS